MSIRLYGFSMHQISIKFIEETINAQLPDPLNNPELFKLVSSCLLQNMLEKQ